VNEGLEIDMDKVLDRNFNLFSQIHPFHIIFLDNVLIYKSLRIYYGHVLSNNGNINTYVKFNWIPRYQISLLNKDILFSKTVLHR